MFNKVLMSSLSLMAFLALAASSSAFSDSLPFDAKIYPSTFCKPEKGVDAYCLDYSGFGFVSNECGRGVTIVCPLIRDKMTSDQAVHGLLVTYRTQETMHCSFKSTRMLIEPGNETHFDECDFSLSPSDFMENIRSTAPLNQACADNAMPDTEPFGLSDWDAHGAYTLTCTLPEKGEFGHYFVYEPE